MKIVREIELRSDTMTKPNMEMRKAMFNAVVGDDGYGEDPTVKELEEMGARMLGKESARFFPTGLMGNLASVMSHCWERGAEAILGDKSHIHMFEQGGIAQLAGIHTRTVQNYDDGTFSIPELCGKIRPNDLHVPRSSLICLENTHNMCSGAVLPLEFIDDVSRVARSNNLPLHVDGARIFNAAVALGQPVDKVLEKCDSVSVCLSKGLGCPAGTIVAGSKSFIEKATRCRIILGGRMRQTGVLAATGIVALTSMVDRLSEDHTHARLIAEAVSALKSDIVRVDLKRVHTNIILLEIDADVLSVSQFCERMRTVTEEEKSDLGDESVIVKMNPMGTSVRMVTHADVSFEDTQLTIKKLQYVINELEKRPKSREILNGY